MLGLSKQQQQQCLSDKSVYRPNSVMVVALAIDWQAGKQHQIVTKNVAQ